jgi:hypothetical protein
MPNANNKHQKLLYYTGTKVFNNFPPNIKCLQLHIPTYLSQHLFFVCLHGRPRQATGVLQPAGLLYRSQH